MIHYREHGQKKTYSKISKEKSFQLIEMVFQQGLRIIDASKELGLNYATAKNIVMKFRKTKIIQNNPKIPESKRCSFKTIGNNKPTITVLCYRGGKPVDTQEDEQK